MTNDCAQQIRQVFDDEGIDYEFRDDYSGRGMYGRTCPAFVVDEPMLVAWAAGRAGIDLPGLRMDNMGRQYVIY